MTSGGRREVVVTLSYWITVMEKVARAVCWVAKPGTVSSTHISSKTMCCFIGFYPFRAFTGVYSFYSIILRLRANFATAWLMLPAHLVLVLMDEVRARQCPVKYSGSCPCMSRCSSTRTNVAISV